jgi:hypothetical protein
MKSVVLKVSISDALGRAFEFCVTEAILSECQKLFPNKVSLTSRAKEMQQRDQKRTPKPNSVKVEYREGGYLYFLFDNGWKLSGRLHTASEWLIKSIKFDIQPINLDEVVPASYI